MDDQIFASQQWGHANVQGRMEAFAVRSVDVRFFDCGGKEGSPGSVAASRLHFERS